jgi:predicted glycosyltransferase
LNYLFIINTEGQVHTWKGVIRKLVEKGDYVSIYGRDYGRTLEVLSEEGFKFRPFKPTRSKAFKALDIFKHITLGFKARFSFKPAFVLGFGVDASVFAIVAGATSIIFTDSEPLGMQNTLMRILSTCIITPQKFTIDLGKKHIRIPSYKELAYLHPDHFSPDESIIKELGIEKGQQYAILRFNAFDAVHDVGRKGFTLQDKYNLVECLGKFAKVFISSESDLPEELKQYELPVSYNRVHDVLYYSNLLIADTGTMAVEASVLGTPSIMCLSNYDEFSNFIELEKEYNLMYCFKDPRQAIKKAVELIQQPGLKAEWQKKREKLLKEKIDLTAFMVEFIERWPQSFNEQTARQVSK